MEITPPHLPAKSNAKTYLELIALLGFCGIPLATILGPLILWLCLRDKDPEARRYGPMVINFHISWTIWTLVSCGLGIIPYLVFFVIRLVKIGDRDDYVAPLTLDLVK